MIRNTAIRIGVVAAVVLTAWLACWALNVSLTPPPTDVPQWSFHDLPRHIGDWRGEPTTLDRKIAEKTGAIEDSIEERLYRDDSGHTIAMHCAMFEDPIPGVYHVPTNCYRAAGWQLNEQYQETVQVSDELTIPVLVTTWEKESERGTQHEIVVYWEQLGEHVLFDRADLGFKVRWSLRGREKWPALLKVMVSMPTNNVDDPKSLILDFAKEIAAWENQPAHHTGVAEAASRAAAGGAANASP